MAMTVCVLISCLQRTVVDMGFCILNDYLASQNSSVWGNFPKLNALRDCVENENTKIKELLAKHAVT